MTRATVVEDAHDEASSLAATSRTMHRRSLLWRIHAWAALIASPFALLATLTGALYIFTPQIEHALYGSFEQVPVSGSRHSLDELVVTALAAVPAGSAVRSIAPGSADNDATSVIVALATPAQHASHEGHEGHDHAVFTNAQASADASKPSMETTLYINPYTNAVIGNLPERERFSSWAKKLHSSLLQGNTWRWMIELAASWLLVMLLTGIYLWWPRGDQSGMPQASRKGRVAWKQWHSYIGVVLGVLTFTMLATGITWSKYAGAQVRHARDLMGQTPPQVPRDLMSIPSGAAIMSWQAAWNVARSVAPDVGLQLTAPRDEQGVWRITNADKRQPTKKVDLVLDAYSGRQLYYAGWDKQTAFSKATAVGIPFHRGELGIWNQVLLMVFALGVLFALLSGWVMFFKRKRSGPLGLPQVVPGALKSVSLTMWLIALCLLVLLPLLAISAVPMLMLECYWWQQQTKVMKIAT